MRRAGGKRGTYTRLRVGTALAMVIIVSIFETGTVATRTARADQARTMMLVGKVVDAACYMIHPPAASIPSHKDCGAACLARGVPLAIANEKDNSLYFPADGNKRLATLLDQRVRVTGTVSRKAEPMESRWRSATAIKWPFASRAAMTS